MKDKTILLKKSEFKRFLLNLEFICLKCKAGPTTSFWNVNREWKVLKMTNNGYPEDKMIKILQKEKRGKKLSGLVKILKEKK